MLQRIRDNLHGPLAYVILGAIALVFVAWGAYGIVDVGIGQGASAAKVNGERIPLETARQAWLDQQAQVAQALGGELPDDRKAELQQGVLDGWGEAVVGVGIIISMAAIVIGDIFSLPRVPFALGRDGVLPRALARVHPVHHTPHVAIAFYCTVACVVALSGTFRQLAIIGVSGTLFVYLVTCLGVLQLRRKGIAEAGKPFVVPGGPVVPLAGSALILYLLFSLEAKELLALGVLLGVAVLASWWTQVRRPSLQPGP